MKWLRWIPIVAGLALAGCAADGSYIGPKRAFDGSFSTLMVDIDGHSSTYNRHDELPLGYLRSGEQEAYSTFSNADGVNSTGLAAAIAACAADPDCIRAALN